MLVVDVFQGGRSRRGRSMEDEIIATFGHDASEFVSQKNAKHGCSRDMIWVPPYPHTTLLWLKIGTSDDWTMSRPSLASVQHDKLSCLHPGRVEALPVIVA